MIPQEAPVREPAADVLVRTAPASTPQRVLLVSVDASTVVVPAVAGAVMIVFGIGAAATACLLVAAAAVGAWIAGLARSGSSLGHTLVSARTVEKDSAAPAGRRVLSALVRGRLRTLDLAHGRDPLSPMFEPYVFPAAAARTAPPSVRYRQPASVRLDSGQTLSLNETLVIGRDPSASADAPGLVYEWPDLSRALSKSHLRLEWDGERAWATDLGSRNGTALVDGARPVPLVPFQRTPLPPAARLELGDRDLTVSAPA